jgi:hypothetical protein
VGQRTFETRSLYLILAEMLFTLPAANEMLPLSALFAGKYREACNWPWPDRMQRNASREMIFAAGRMTATARADIGARFEARPKSVGLGLRTDV